MDHDEYGLQRRKAVLVVAHSWYGDSYGGAFRVATELAVELAASGYQVVYLCCNCGDFAQREVIQGVEVRRYKVDGRNFCPPRAIQHVLRSRELAQELFAEFDIQAVSGHSPLQYLGVLQAGHRRHVNYTYVVHSPFADELQAAFTIGERRMSLRARSFVASFIDRWCLWSSTSVQCLSQFTIQLLSRAYGRPLAKRCVEIPGWVDTNRFSPVADSTAERLNLPSVWHTSEPILLSVRRLEPRMGLDTLIAAVARIAPLHSFRVLIGGTGSESERLERAIKESGLEERVFLLGRIPEEQLPKCYAAADVFVLPTRSLECFGLIVLESFATNTPVIGSRAGAIPELLSQAGEDWLFEPGNVEQLADRLDGFLRGTLIPLADLREIALRYDRRVVVPKWIEHCLGLASISNKKPIESNGTEFPTNV